MSDNYRVGLETFDRIHQEYDPNLSVDLIEYIRVMSNQAEDNAKADAEDKAIVDGIRERVRSRLAVKNA